MIYLQICMELSVGETYSHLAGCFHYYFDRIRFSLTHLLKNFVLYSTKNVGAIRAYDLHYHMRWILKLRILNDRSPFKLPRPTKRLDVRQTLEKNVFQDFIIYKLIAIIQYGCCKNCYRFYDASLCV